MKNVEDEDSLSDDRYHLKDLRILQRNQNQGLGSRQEISDQSDQDQRQGTKISIKEKV